MGCGNGLWTTDGMSTMRCIDGSSCDTDTEGWGCCIDNGGRAQCPMSHPLMCARRICGGGDHCCEQDCGDFGGIRECPACPWLKSSGGMSTMRCADGSSCDTDTEGWGCCTDKGGRAQCPDSHPLMCAQRCEGGDHCCEQDCVGGSEGHVSPVNDNNDTGGACGSMPVFTDWGYDDAFRGWYDISGCGVCNDHCR